MFFREVLRLRYSGYRVCKTALNHWEHFAGGYIWDSERPELCIHKADVVRELEV